MVDESMFGFTNRSEFAKDPRNPIGTLHHYFITCIGIIRTLLQEEAYRHNSVLSPEECQVQLARGISELGNIIQRIEGKELDPTDEINPKTLGDFIKFLNGFVGDNRKLTLEESEAIQKKFDEMFPTH